MRLSIRTKQVLGVTLLVGIVVTALSIQGMAMVARVRLEESQARADLLARAIYQRARLVAPGAAEPYEALRNDEGLRAILESSIYSKNVTYAAITAPDGAVVAHYDSLQIGTTLAEAPPITELLSRPALSQLQHVYGEEGRTYEVQEPLELGGDFGTIRIGISTLLIRDDLNQAVMPALKTAGWLLLGSTAVALLLAQWLLRPIHVLRSGLQRLERGESAASLDLPQDEFGDLGREITAVSEKLLLERPAAEPEAGLGSIVEHLEDAVGIFTAQGELLFANPKLRGVLETAAADGGGQPFEALVAETRASRVSSEPRTMHLSGAGGEPPGEWLVDAHPLKGPDREVFGVMVVARDLDRLGEVESTFRYSRKLAALGRLTAGVAHEVKNPLNAMTIHLELLKSKLRASRVVAGGHAEPPPVNVDAVMEHVNVIGAEIRRLDQVVQGFLKFMRPEDLRLEPVAVAELLNSVARTVEPDARAGGVTVQVECDTDVPPVNADAGPLRQALLNLALNACQAMPSGGMLRLTARSLTRRRVRLTVEDTGLGIPADQLPRIFDLYYTTKPGGSGIGLSMVFRTIQMLDGEVEVRSTPGSGATFQIVLPQAPAGSVLGLR